MEELLGKIYKLNLEGIKITFCPSKANTIVIELKKYSFNKKFVKRFCVTPEVIAVLSIVEVISKMKEKLEILVENHGNKLVIDGRLN